MPAVSFGNLPVIAWLAAPIGRPAMLQPATAADARSAARATSPPMTRRSARSIASKRASSRAAGDAWWPLAMARELDDAILMLRADKKVGNIQLDSETQLTGVPPEAWTYKLGNRSALEWILDQYKEKTLKDPTIREKFNTYRFADHKEKVIDLLKRITRLSVETMKIVEEMK